MVDGRRGRRMAACRIASLISSATEILFALQLGDRVIAVSHECDFPVEIAGLPRVTASRVDPEQSSQLIDDQVRQLAEQGAPLYEIDQRQLSQLAPDLIVTQAQCDVCAVRYEDVLALVESDAALGNTHVLPLNPASLEDLLLDVQRVAEAAGAAANGRALVAQLRQRIQACAKSAATIAAADRPRVLCVEWIQPLMFSANWVPELVTLAGGRQDLTRAGEQSGYSEWDALIAFDPQILLLMPCGFDLRRTIQESRELARMPGWRELSAVRDQRVFAVDGNAYFNRSGPRLVDSLEMLAYFVHPDSAPESAVRQQRNVAWRRLETSGDLLLPVP